MRQNRLNEAYNAFKHRLTLNDDDILESFYAPLLISVPEEWSRADHRILWVGQETQGWNWEKVLLEADGMHWPYSDVASLKDFTRYDSSVEALIYGYEEFAFARNNRVRNSPFWRYFRRTLELWKEKGSSSAIWTNAIRCAAMTKKGYNIWSVSPSERRQLLDYQFGLLTEEISILEPTIVIFVCGPDYDAFIQEEFENCVYEEFPVFAIRQFAKLRHKNLPNLSFRTYHPRYLSISGLKLSPIEAVLSQYV